MNINDLNRIKFLNIEEELSKEVEPGTFKEILDMVYADKIIPLVNNAGTILGVSVDPGCNDILKDNIAQAIFDKRYLLRPVMTWVMKALECKAVGKIITDVAENAETGEVVITLQNGITETLIEGIEPPKPKDTSTTYVTPTDNIRIEIEDLDPEVDEVTAIARYLRTTYQRYLSRDAAIQFKYVYDADDECYIVNEVKWGRRI